MIIRGVILFLSVVDFVCDTYDRVKDFGVKANKAESESKQVLQNTETSFSL